MTLLAPLAMWLFASAAAVVALYLLKIRRRREVVPALEFWRNLAGRTQSRSLFQRLKRWLSMFLWLLIVTCLVLAIGNPVLAVGKIKPRSIALIIDNSASMQTVEGDTNGETRFDSALQAANDIVSMRPVRDEWLLIEAEREPRVLQGWTRRSRDIHEQVARISPFEGAADLPVAVELAGDLLVGRENPTVILISDGAGIDLEQLKQKAGGAEFILWPVGTRNDNLGITRVSVRLHPQQLTHHVLARVVNSGDETIEASLNYEVDGSAVDVQPISIDPHGVWERTITIDRPLGGVLRVSLDHDDALAMDNVAFAVLPPVTPASVWLVSPPEQSFFFEQALRAMDTLIALDDSRTFTIDAFNQLGAIRPQDMPDLVIFNNCSPTNMPAAGRFVFVNDWPDTLPARKIGELEMPHLMLSEREHGLTRFLNLRPVTLARAHRVDLAEAATVLARSDDGSPLIFVIEHTDRTSLCVAFNVMTSDLPFRNAFPILLRNAVTTMPREAARQFADQYSIGDVISPLRPLPDNVSNAKITAIDASNETAIDVPIANGTFHLPVNRATAMRIDIGDESRYTAVNLTDAGESSIAPAVLEAGDDPSQRLGLSRRLFGATPWLALAGLALVLILLEWCTYHYRWTE